MTDITGREYIYGIAQDKNGAPYLFNIGELVRCKDCRYYTNNHLCEQLSRFGSIEPLADFHCGFGERREP